MSYFYGLGGGSSTTSVEEISSTQALTSAHLNKHIRLTNTEAIELTLPEATEGLVGKAIRFSKTAAHEVTITANGTDVIGASSAGGSVYNDDALNPNESGITLFIEAAGVWKITEKIGVWYTY